MTYNINKTRKGTTIRAHGEDAMALFEAITWRTAGMRTEQFKLVNESYEEYNERMRKLRRTDEKKSREEEEANQTSLVCAALALETAPEAEPSCDTSSSDTGSCDTSDFSGDGGNFGGAGSSDDF